MKDFLKNIRKMPLAYALNIIGMTVAFTAAILILLSVKKELTFDHKIKDSDRIYRIEKEITPQYGGGILPILSYPNIMDIIQSSPMIESGTCLCPFDALTFFTVDFENKKAGYKEDFIGCSEGFLKTFDVKIIAGDTNGLNSPEKIIIPESLALKLFGNNRDAIGKNIHFYKTWITNRTDFTISAVYKDFAENTHLKNSFYYTVSNQHIIENRGSNNFYSYIKLKKTNIDQINEVITNYEKLLKDSGITFGAGNGNYNYTALRDIYYSHKCSFDDSIAHGNKSTTNILLGIAILILLLAIINFTNFSMALIPFRIKSINIRKVLGEKNSRLRYSLIKDSVYLMLTSMIFAILILFLISQYSSANSLFSSTHLMNEPLLIIEAILFSISIGIIVDLYPAKYSTSFSPALILKGDFGLSKRGLLLRRILVSIQFIISISLIAISLFIQKQNSYMKNSDLGFNTEHLFILNINHNLAKLNLSVIEDNLNKIPGVNGVAFSFDKLCSVDFYTFQGYNINNDNKKFYKLICSWNLPDVLNIKITDGRSFKLSDHYKKVETILINETSTKNYDCSLENSSFTSWNGTQVNNIGVFKDIKLLSMLKKASPMLFSLPIYTPSAYYDYCYAYIRYDKNLSPINLLKKIKTTMNEIDPYYPFDIENFNDIITERYQSEIKFSKAINIFSILAIIISLIGIFGLILFDIQQKKKELAIRRIHGANEIDIIKQFTKPYLVMLGICSVISIPIIIYTMRFWLSKFVYKITLDPWAFITSILIAFVFTLLLIIYQVKSALRRNPIRSIKSE